VNGATGPGIQDKGASKQKLQYVKCVKAALFNRWAAKLLQVGSEMFRY